METYTISITFPSGERKFLGDEKTYFFHYKKGDKVGIGSAKSAKRYLSYKRAENMARILQKIYPENLIMIV